MKEEQVDFEMKRCLFDGLNFRLKSIMIKLERETFQRLKAEYQKFIAEFPLSKRGEAEIGLWYLLTKMNQGDIAKLSPEDQNWRT